MKNAINVTTPVASLAPNQQPALLAKAWEQYITKTDFLFTRNIALNAWDKASKLKIHAQNAMGNRAIKNMKNYQ